MNFTTTIFDMDGTLFDTERIALDAWQTAFREQGAEVPRQALEAVIGVDGKGTKAFLSRFVPAGVGIEDLTKRTVAVMNRHIEQHGFPVKVGAVELLAYLKARGATIGLATSTSTDRAQSNLKRAGLAGYFRAVIGGDQVERGKPHPDIYLKALAVLGAAPADAIALEDSDYGIQAAFAAGLRVIHIPDIKRIEAETMACVHRQYATLLDFKEEIAA
jgi:HAD superfamily hydrolase (TIGR01509 family)